MGGVLEGSQGSLECPMCLLGRSLRFFGKSGGAVGLLGSSRGKANNNECAGSDTEWGSDALCVVNLLKAILAANPRPFWSSLL